MLQTQAKPAELVHYITLDNLLEKYQKEPIPDFDCQLPEPKQGTKVESGNGITTYICDDGTGEAVNYIVTELNSRLGTEFEKADFFQVIEMVQNIGQHCADSGRKAKIKFYISSNKDKLLGALELNTKCGFGSKSLEDYLRSLEKMIKEITKMSGSGKPPLANYEMLEKDFFMGTYLTLISGKTSRIGFVDIENKPYYFFEYNIKTI